MKRVLFNLVKDTLRSIDIDEIQKTCKDFADAIQQVPFPINNFENFSQENCFVTPSRVKVDIINQNERVYTIDIFGFEKSELKVKIENDILVVSGLKKNKIGVFPEGFVEEIPMLNSKLNGKIRSSCNVLIIPIITIPTSFSEDLEIH